MDKKKDFDRVKRATKSLKLKVVVDGMDAKEFKEMKAIIMNAKAVNDLPSVALDFFHNLLSNVEEFLKE